MAGDWMPVDCNIATKPEVLMVALKHQLEPEVVVGRMIRLWAWAWYLSADGKVPAGLDAVAAAAGGDADFWKSVRDVGWLIVGENSVEIPGWEDRFSNAAKRRMENTRYQKDKRAVSKLSAKRQQNVSKVADKVLTPSAKCQQDSDEVLTVSANCQQVADKVLMRGEERRVEEKRGENLETPFGVSCSERLTPHGAEAGGEVLPDAPQGPPEALSGPKRRSRVYRVTWSETAGFEGITEADRERWKKAFPAVDLELEFAQMENWLVSNPAKAVRSNWLRFISSWFKREQDRGGSRKSNPVSNFLSPEERRNAQSIKDAEARDRFNYSWRPDARKMMGEAEYQEWRAGYEREIKRRRAEQAKANGLAQE